MRVVERRVQKYDVPEISRQLGRIVIGKKGVKVVEKQSYYTRV